MDWTEYAALDGLNATVLKEGRRSMKHLQHALNHAREDTITFGKGRAFHCLVLEPENFDRDFAIWRGGVRRGKAWDEFCGAHRGQTIIKADEYGHCQEMAASVMEHPIAGPLMREAGEAEKVITWIDPLTEVPCKSRLDKLTASTVIDLKMSQDIEAHRFGSLAARYGYHLQMAWYVQGLRVLGMERKAKIVAVEPVAPYDVATFDVDDAALYAGEEEIKEILAKFSAGMFSGLWPGRYWDGPVPLELPSYVFPDTSVAEDLGLILSHAEEEA